MVLGLKLLKMVFILVALTPAELHVMLVRPPQVPLYKTNIGFTKLAVNRSLTDDWLGVKLNQTSSSAIPVVEHASVSTLVVAKMVSVKVDE